MFNMFIQRSREQNWHQKVLESLATMIWTADVFTEETLAASCNVLAYSTDKADVLMKSIEDGNVLIAQLIMKYPDSMHSRQHVVPIGNSSANKPS